MGNDKLSLMIEGSLFDSNAIRPPLDVGAIDVTVRLNTGSFTIDLSNPNTELNYDNEIIIPIWRVDDGPVHGISFELCQAAKRHSETAVSKGFPASFPSDLQCANVSYAGPEKTYNHVVSLAAGEHTLWTGVLMEVRTSRLRSAAIISHRSDWALGRARCQIKAGSRRGLRSWTRLALCSQGCLKCECLELWTSVAPHFGSLTAAAVCDAQAP